MAHIAQLQNEVASLQAETGRWQNSAEEQSGQRAKLEAELGKAKFAFRALRKESIELKENYDTAKRQSHQLKTREDALNGDVRQLMAVAHRLAAVSRLPPYNFPEHKQVVE